MMEKTTPYLPEQNGVAERANRTIVEMARAMIKDANLPKSLWSEACKTAAYLRNRLPSSANDNNTPHFLMAGKVPDVSHLRVFGSPVFVKIPDEHRRKLDDKAKAMVMVGYTFTPSNYRIYDPVTKKLSVARTIAFNESRPNQEDYENQIRETVIPLDTETEVALQPVGDAEQVGDQPTDTNTELTDTSINSDDSDVSDNQVNRPALPGGWVPGIFNRLM